MPNIFSSGQPARAAEVNANFADIESQIAAIQTTYDYRDFTVPSNVTSKNFVTTGASFCGTHEERSYSRTVNNTETNITVTRKRHTSGAVCQWNDYLYRNTATERQLLGTTVYDTMGVLTGNNVLDEAVILETASMGKNLARVSGAINHYTPVSWPC